MGRKMPNGFGSVRKLSGNRKKPYVAVVTTGFEIVDGKKRQIQKSIGYAAKYEDAVTLLSEYRKSPFDISVNPTFAEVYNVLDMSRKSQNSKQAMKTAYGRCTTLYEMKIRDIKKIHLQRIADSMTRYSKATQQEVRILWGMVLRYGMENDILIKDYSKFIDWHSDYVPRPKLPYTAEQVDQFSDDLKILCYTGMRISEYLAVKTADVYDGVIHNVGTKTTSSHRDIPIHSKLAEIVNLRLVGVYLCQGINGQMKYNYFRNHIYLPELKRLGITGHTPHDSRRTFCTFADSSKVDKIMTKRMLGHKSGDITEDVYNIPFIKTMQKQMDMVKIM